MSPIWCRLKKRRRELEVCLGESYRIGCVSSVLIRESYFLWKVIFTIIHAFISDRIHNPLSPSLLFPHEHDSIIVALAPNRNLETTHSWASHALMFLPLTAAYPHIVGEWLTRTFIRLPLGSVYSLQVG